jgi:hypothetical protein
MLLVYVEDILRTPCVSRYTTHAGSLARKWQGYQAPGTPDAKRLSQRLEPCPVKMEVWPGEGRDAKEIMGVFSL